MSRVVVDPVTRIEGHLRIEAEPFETFTPATEAALSGLFAAFPRR